MTDGAFWFGAIVGLVGGAALASLWTKRTAARLAAALRADRAAEAAAREREIDETADGLREAFRALSADALDRVDARLAELSRGAAGAQAALGEQVRALAAAHANLGAETARLAAALRTPGARGRWGELQLRRVVELAGLSPHCDFAPQLVTDGARPDLVVLLPGARRLAVDAKAPLEAYLAAQAAEDDAARRAHLVAHARAVRAHVRALAGRDYAARLGGVELVVMFLPGEAFLAAALEADPALLDAAADAGVALTTPSSLIALLRAVALGWREAQAAEHAAEAAQLARTLHQRLRGLADAMHALGRQLAGAVERYNGVVGKLEGPLLAAARRLGELGGGGGPVRALAELDVAPATPTASASSSPAALAAPPLVSPASTAR